MTGTDGGGGTLDGGRPGKLMPDRKASSCVLGDEGSTTTKMLIITCILGYISHKRTMWAAYHVVALYLLVPVY